MSILTTPDTVTVWIENGVPARLVWKGIRYQVTDTPTPIRGSILHDLLTHPLEPVIGWRFQGTSEAADADAEVGQGAVSPPVTHVFDVHGGFRQEWRLVAVYD